jgi:hypothetical protein
VREELSSAPSPRIVQPTLLSPVEKPDLSAQLRNLALRGEKASQSTPQPCPQVVYLTKELQF